jgi:flagellar hook-basal body complex protein FliE
MSISSIAAVGGERTAGAPASAGPKSEGGFARSLNDLLGGASAQDAKASEAVQQLATGQTDNLHGVALAAAKADLSLRLVVEVRNKLQDAYQEVMRMQV